ncbi:LacI family DNA-binding transcriptional regulator [Advenella kashmirensis]
MNKKKFESQNDQNLSKRQSRHKGNSVTIRDVAREAGVSVATVSRVLNKFDTVGAEIRDHVLDVATKLRYSPQAAARALATQKSRVIGAIIPTLEDLVFARAVEILQSRLQNNGYTLLLGISNYDKQEEFRQVQALAGQGAVGVFLVGAERDERVYAYLNEKQIAYINSWVLDSNHPSVGFDNELIGFTVANYLLDLGHRKFAIITQYWAESDRASSRIKGVERALAARKASAPSIYAIKRSHKISDGQLAMRSLWQNDQSITAVICGSDTLAFGAMIEAVALGLRVPDDISITGINDLEFAAHTSPPLTTVGLQAAEVGERAAEYLMANAEGRDTVKKSSIPFNLIVRGSTGPARSRSS